MKLLVGIIIGLIPTLAPLAWEMVKEVELPTLEVNIRSAYSILLGLICASSMLRFILFVYLISSVCLLVQYWNNIFSDNALPLTFVASTVIEELRKKPLPKVLFAPLAFLEFVIYLSSFTKEASRDEDNSATNAGPVWAPFENFNINFFYCKVRFWIHS